MKKESPDHRDAARTTRIATIPNIICVLRFLGAIVLVGLARADQAEAFLWLFVVLAISDWIDGKLAILLNQRSVWGPRLDSWADAALYLALLMGAIWLQGDSLRAEIGWILPALASYALSTLAGFWKYHRWPSYHTRAAKTSWLLILLGAVCLFADWGVWPLKVALVAVTLTNLEALLITALSPIWQADVGSILQVLRARRSR